MIFTWDIDPVLFTLGPVEVRYYGVLFAFGLMMAANMGTHFFKKQNYDPDDIDSAVLWMILGIIVGAHWVHLIFYETESIWMRPSRWLNPLEYGAGLASHGGVLGIVVVFYWIAKKRNQPMFRYGDPLAVGTMWLAFSIRLGNFFNSEIYGRVTDGSWGVIFARRGFTEPRHPTQLYESAFGVVLLMFTYWFYNKNFRRMREGSMFFFVIWLYFICRFFVEFFKEFQALDSSLPLTMGQLLTIPIVAGLTWVLWKHPKYKLLPFLSEEREFPAEPEGYIKSLNEKASKGAKNNKQKSKSKKKRK